MSDESKSVAAIFEANSFAFQRSYATACETLSEFLRRNPLWVAVDRSVALLSESAHAMGEHTKIRDAEFVEQTKRLTALMGACESYARQVEILSLQREQHVEQLIGPYEDASNRMEQKLTELISNMDSQLKAKEDQVQELIRELDMLKVSSNNQIVALTEKCHDLEEKLCGAQMEMQQLTHDHFNAHTALAHENQHLRQTIDQLHIEISNLTQSSADLEQQLHNARMSNQQLNNELCANKEEIARLVQSESESRQSLNQSESANAELQKRLDEKLVTPPEDLQKLQKELQNLRSALHLTVVEKELIETDLLQLKQSSAPIRQKAIHSAEEPTEQTPHHKLDLHPVYLQSFEDKQPVLHNPAQRPYNRNTGAIANTRTWSFDSGYSSVQSSMHERHALRPQASHDAAGGRATTENSMRRSTSGTLTRPPSTETAASTRDQSRRPLFSSAATHAHALHRRRNNRERYSHVHTPSARKNDTFEC
eukprot:TRINITY_DN3995_c0_g1_i1.p1 TRINITY_DN3995_c0_g1~~TRINITY_DN3995_c0_g1_i1.p1  ORF type:complete len:515 (+),score=121.04 TRINITY_DN3995_c0_g1_i1:103-1545(+)